MFSKQLSLVNVSALYLTVTQTNHENKSILPGHLVGMLNAIFYKGVIYVKVVN